MNVAVFTDFAKGQKKKIEDLKKAQLLKERNILTAVDFVNQDEADIEDLIGRDGYVKLVEGAYALPTALAIPSTSPRIVKDVEDAFKLLPPDAPEFDHFGPSSFLISNPSVLASLPEANEALTRFEQLFSILNSLL
jgi:hypothetical protein